MPPTQPEFCLNYHSRTLPEFRNMQQNAKPNTTAFQLPTNRKQKGKNTGSGKVSAKNMNILVNFFAE